MEALITASGLGTRLRQITYTRPKALVEVCGRPILDYIFDYLNKAGIEDEKITVTVGYRSKEMLDHLSSRTDIKYVISYTPESMSHVINVASHLMKEPFVVVDGDTIQPASAILDSYKVFCDLKLSALFHCPRRNNESPNKIIKFEEYLNEHDRLERETNGKEYIKYTAVFYSPAKLQEVEDHVPLRDQKFKHTKLGELMNRSGGNVRCLFTNNWYVSINTPKQLADAEDKIKQLIVLNEL